MTSVEGATLRALTGIPELLLHGPVPYRGGTPVRIPVAHVRPEHRSAAVRRGSVDAIAARLRYSDPGLLRATRPEHPVARAVFEQLEQFRVEALAPPELPGVAANLRRCFADWSEQVRAGGHLETARGLLLYTVAVICHARVTGEPIPEAVEDLIEQPRYALAPALGEQLARLRRSRDDQAAYAGHAREIAETLARMLGDPGEPERAPDSAGALLVLGAESEGGHPGTRGGKPETGGETAPYRVFTTAHDRQQHATELVRAAQLREYRQRLDRLVAGQGIAIGPLARKLHALLAEPRVDGWLGGQEEGHVDGRALSQLICAPADHRVFRVERTEPVPDVLVTFLLDCSGSMKRHIEAVAVLVDVFARALDRAGAACEVLGFSTGGFHGGRARRDWLRAGSPPDPGRLAERRHLVFKEARTPWRRGRSGIAALFREDLYREGIDGEAVRWAAERAEEQSWRRQVLVLVSDGAPMERSTELANGSGYLERHLRAQLSALDRAGREVLGLGLGLDLGRTLRRHRELDTESLSGQRMVAEVLAALAR
ncbi:cobaltochelatase CobT-related protein [Sciscionella sediminilitoris]|uniref:cobaltochelatase CobT-related protein n=1 Tax=Sciscionella sediminilitoris TaxID=1445613 RepID=UPI0004DEF54C|nr:cobalt chelatase [Sciscionella sp. SE31]